MNDLKAIFDIDFPTFILWILIIIGGAKVIVESVKWVGGQFGIEFKHVRKRNEEHDLLYKTIGRVDELETIQKQSNEEFKNYDNALKGEMEKISGMINNLEKKIDAMEEKSDATERASLKDRIATLYRKYNIEKQWGSMERESFNGLIKDYEAHGGKNSFVHDVCEPASFTWVVTDEDEVESIEKNDKKNDNDKITKVWQV